MRELHLKIVPHLRNAYINDEYVDNADNLDIVMPMRIWLNIEIIIQTLQDVYGSLKKTKKIWTMETLLRLLQLIHHPNTNQVFF